MTNACAEDQGIIRIQSRHSVPETADRLEAMLKAHGIVVFARIDFSGDAKRVGLEMLPEQLVIFGNPKAGTPLMIAQPTVGLDLPLRALIWEDAQGRSWLAYNDPVYIVRRHAVVASLAANLAAVAPILEQAADE